MRKCHYIYDEIAGKVLIPGCWSVVNSDDTNDIKNCTCENYPNTFAQFEKQEYNKKLNEQKEYIIELEKENEHLHKILLNRKIPFCKS